MKNLSVVTMNKFDRPLSTFPKFNTLTTDAVVRIEKALQNEKVLTLAQYCIKTDYAVAMRNYELNNETASDRMNRLFGCGVVKKGMPVLILDDYYVYRYIVQNFFGVTASCVVPLSAWKKAYLLSVKLYNPYDLGQEGKKAEVRRRLEVYTVNGYTKTTWSQFFAHKSGQKDIVDRVEGINIESKTGVGDWFTSKKSKTLEAMRKELERKTNDILEWNYTKIIHKEATKRKPARDVKLEIKYRKTWKEFFTVLEGYNGDIGTWFKPIKSTGNGYKLQMQEIQNSEKKLEYLMQFNDD